MSDEISKLLFEFAKRHHEFCEDCEGTGKVYKHHDPTTMQWISCPIDNILKGIEPFR